MAVRYEEVDFLIVTSFKEETAAVSELLEEKTQAAHHWMGKISREGYTDKYVVALTEIGGKGTAAAQAAASKALTRLTPKRVILTGIAAGFPEAGVKPGDILVPYAIADYELAKIKENSTVGGDRVKSEHRGLAICVSYGLWHAANTLGRDEGRIWANAIAESRPDGTRDKPVVHSKMNSVLGTGEKVVATKFAETRRWLLEVFPDQAIGLEMEAHGVQRSCHVTDTPFLVVKASQDPGTKEKDIPDEKDVWRLYAAQAAAAFTIELIRRFELQYDTLILEHMKKVKGIAQHYDRTDPQPSFTYCVSLAKSYADLKAGFCDLRSAELRLIVPNDVDPLIALHGGGGTGKTRILHSLLHLLIDSGFIPVLVNLRKYSIQRQYTQEADDTKSLITEILLASSEPRTGNKELERLAKEGLLVILIDGLSEVSNEVRSTLIDYFQLLHREGTCFVVVTDRFGPQTSLELFKHAAVDRLDPTFVENIFDGKFGASSFKQLDERLQRIYQRPFFLSLSLKSEKKFSESQIWSRIFENFFIEQLRMTSEQLSSIAAATVGALKKNGTFDFVDFKARTGVEIYHVLVAAEVLSSDYMGFEHHLWRDYLVSRHLAKNQNDWKDSVFDVITTFASSLESLSLTIEQMPDQALKDIFLKKVFDWNYFAAADCIANFCEDDPEPRQLSPSIRSAVLYAIAEKRFDPVYRTRQRAEELLGDHRYGIAKPFLRVKTFEALTKHVLKLSGAENWFIQWKSLLKKASKEGLSSEEIKLISSNDSLIGWTAANAARRSRLDRAGQKQIREIYEKAGSADDKRSIRWRAVHVLGAYPDVNNIRLLLKAASDDPYHWVQYGALRSLIEMGSQCRQDLRDQALNGVVEFIKSYSPVKLWIRRQILREIVEAAFIQSSQPGWKDAVLPILTQAVELETNHSHKDVLNARLEEFKNYY